MSAKIQCPSCRELVPLQEFQTSARGLSFRCPACGNVQNVPNASSGEPAAPGREAGAALDRICPKCGHAQPGGQNCVLCGLHFENAGHLLAPPDEVVAAFERLDTEHDDPAELEEFIIVCEKAGRLDWATRQARILGRVPERAALARAMRARIVERAQAQLVPLLRADRSLGDTENRKRIWLWVVLVLSLGLLIWVVSSASALLQKMP